MKIPQPKYSLFNMGYLKSDIEWAGADTRPFKITGLKFIVFQTNVPVDWKYEINHYRWVDEDDPDILTIEEGEKLMKKNYEISNNRKNQ